MRYFEIGILGLYVGNGRWRQFQENCESVDKALLHSEGQMEQLWLWRNRWYNFRWKWYNYYRRAMLFTVYQRILAAVKRGQFVSVIMSHIVLGGHWCADDDEVPNSPAPTEVNINTEGGYYLTLRRLMSYIYIYGAPHSWCF